MGKKVKEYKSGDFIFAKVKGYPAWPARVQKLNGKKYFVYFYGTGETANLPPNMIFDYAENKDKFLTKSVKRRDFNEGVKQIEHDFANNVPLELVIGEAAAPAANDTANDTGNETLDTTMADTTSDDTVADSTAVSQNDTTVEDSDDAGALIIDEGKKANKKQAAKTPAKETPKAPKTPRGRPKKEEKEEEEEKTEKKEEEIVSRSGRKIRPKRYIDEQIEENATLPSPANKRKRGASPAPASTPAPAPASDKDKEKTDKDKVEKTVKQYNAVPQSELEDLKEPFKPADAEKENIIIAYLPTGQYVGVKLFQSRPTFKNDAARLQWDKQAAGNALTLKMQLEKGQITPQSIVGQLVMDLNLTDEEKGTLDKDRETEEKKARVQFLKSEMKLIEVDAKIKTCLCLEKADTEMCLKLLDELLELEVKPLMLLKHPTCVETVKRMRAYVGNTPSWDLSEHDALAFSKQAHRIRRQAETVYRHMKKLFPTPEGLSFWEFFSERVLQFKKATTKLNADELLEMVNEPAEMAAPSSTTMKAAIDAANELESTQEAEKEEAKKTPVKNKKSVEKPNNTPTKPTLKRQSSRKANQDTKEKEAKKTEEPSKKADEAKKKTESNKKSEDNNKKTDEANKKSEDNNKKSESNKKTEEGSKKTDKKSEDSKKSDSNKKSDETSKKTDSKKSEETNKKSDSKKSEETNKKSDSNKKSEESSKKSDKKVDETSKKDSNKKTEETDKEPEENAAEETEKETNSHEENLDKETDQSKDNDIPTETTDKPESTEPEKMDTDTVAEEKEKEKSQEKEPEEVNKEAVEVSDKVEEKEKVEENGKDKEEEKEIEEPRAKRSRGEAKKTEAPPPRSPAKRKAKS